MKVKDTIIVVLLLIIALLCFVTGYHMGAQRKDEQQEARFRLIVDKAIYEAAQRNNLQKVQSSSSILLLGDVRNYERRFGAPGGTNRFDRDFASAEILAQHIESQLVPISSITNSLPTNMTLKIDGE